MSDKATQYDLEDRTFVFAKRVRQLMKNLPQSFLNIDDCRQLIRSSGSVGANYIEANNSLSRKDFRMRIKICRKEAKESGYWLHLIDPNGKSLDAERNLLLDESLQLMKIFGAILRNTQLDERQSH